MTRDEAIKRLTIGDLDKSFHRPECACTACEHWRTVNGKPTFASLESLVKATCTNATNADNPIK